MFRKLGKSLTAVLEGSSFEQVDRFCNFLGVASAAGAVRLAVDLHSIPAWTGAI